MSFNHLQEGYIYYLNSMDNTIKNPFIDQLNSENIIDNNNISIPFDNEIDLKEKEKQKELNIIKRQKNLVNLADLPQERRKEISSLGGKARARQMIQEKSMRDSAKALLKTVVSKEYATKILGGSVDVSGIETMQDLLVAKMMAETLENGNAKAFELIRDTSGNKPTAEIDLRADIVTAADRALIDKVADRLGLVDITDDDDK